jgi:hypothetical protein
MYLQTYVVKSQTLRSGKARLKEPVERVAGAPFGGVKEIRAVLLPRLGK